MCIRDSRWFYPTHFTAMSYTLSPEPDSDISICDCAEGEMCIRDRDVAVWGVATDILALLHHLDCCRCGLYGKVFAVCGVDDAAHNHFQTARCAFVIVAVIALSLIHICRSGSGGRLRRASPPRR